MASKSVHITLSIPIRLKQKMDDHRKSKRVNWSKVACRAFHQYLKEHQR